MVKLRGHHLVCLHFFAGEGYTQEFVDNLKGVVEKLERGAELEVVAGPDDVCARCPSLKGSECAEEPGAEAAIREMDTRALAQLGLTVGGRARWEEVRARLLRVPQGWLAGFCAGCRFEGVCAEKKKDLGLL